MPKRLLTPIPGVGGINLQSDPRRIRDDQLVKCKNLVPIRPGILATRPSMNATGVSHTLSINYEMATFYLPFGSDYQIAYMGANDVGLTIYMASLSDPTNVYPHTYTLTTPLEVDRKAAWFQMGRKAYVFFGGPLPAVGKIIQALSPPDPFTGLDFEIVDFAWAGTGNGFIPKHAVSYRNRAVYMNCGVGYENYVVMSNDYDPQTVGNSVLSSRAFQVGGRDGDQITGGVEVLLTAVGSPAQSALLIFREYSTYMLTGELDQTTGGDTDLEVNRISFDCGCSSQSTIVSTPHGTIWAGPDDVWIFRAGQVPQRIGGNIRAALQQTPVNYRFLWHATYHDGFYRLALFGEQNQPSSLSSMCDSHYWLDLRDGVPNTSDEAKWYGPQVYENIGSSVADGNDVPGTRSFVQGTLVNLPQRPYALRLYPDSLIGASAVATFLVDMAGNNFNDTDTLTAQLAHMSDQSANILPDLRGKEYDMGDPMLRKLYRGLEANVSTSEPGQFTAEAILDGGRAVDTAAAEATGLGFRLDGDELDAGLIGRVVQTLKFNADADSRAAGYTVQPTFTGQAGYLVNSENNELDFFVDTGALSGDYTAEIPEGLYDNLEDFIDAVCDAMSAAVPGPLTFSGVISAGLVTISASIGSFFFYFQGLVPADHVSSRIVGMMLGYDISVDPGIDSDLSAISEVPYARAPRVEIGGLILHTAPILRRPT